MLPPQQGLDLSRPHKHVPSDPVTARRSTAPFFLFSSAHEGDQRWELKVSFSPRKFKRSRKQPAERKSRAGNQTASLQEKGEPRQLPEKSPYSQKKPGAHGDNAGTGPAPPPDPQSPLTPKFCCPVGCIIPKPAAGVVSRGCEQYQNGDLIREGLGRAGFTAKSLLRMAWPFTWVLWHKHPRTQWILGLPHAFLAVLGLEHVSQQQTAQGEQEIGGFSPNSAPHRDAEHQDEQGKGRQQPRQGRPPARQRVYW